MAATSTVYSGDGVTRDFLIGFTYTSRNFVKVYVGGILVGTPGTYTFLTGTTIRFGVAPVAGTNNIEIRRVTSTTPLVDFVGAATITDTDLDLAIDQCLDLLEENQNNSIVGMQQSGGNWDATSDRIINVATPLAGTDAANKDYADAVVGSASAAAASAATASSAASDALTYAGNALTYANLALVHSNNAEASADSIAASIPVSGLTVDEVPVATGATTYDAIAVRLTKRLSSGTPSAVTSFDIALPGTHDEYLLDIYNFVISNAGADLHLKFSVDGGATYIGGGGNEYDYVTRGEIAVGNADVAQDADGKIILANSLNNALNQSQMLINIFPGAGGVIFNNVRYRGCLQTNSGGHESMEVHGAGRCSSSATRATHVRILVSAGTVTGNYVLYGVKR